MESSLNASSSSFCSRLEAELCQEAVNYCSAPGKQSPGADAEGASASARSAPRRLPCLKSNNSNEGGAEKLLEKWQQLNSNHRKSAEAVNQNARSFVHHFGLERVGFLTLTFPDQVKDIREAQRRFNCLATGVLNEQFQGWAKVVERHKSKALHHHVLVGVSSDIRTRKGGGGPVDFEAFQRRDYRTANEALRELWAFWRRTAPKYGFGRTELLPIKSTAEAVSKYVGKYIAKHIGQRDELDKGVRLVSYSKGVAKWGTNFAWCYDERTGRGAPGDLYRHKLGLLAEALGCTSADWAWNEALKRAEFRPFEQWFGEHWGFILGPIIESIRLPVYRSEKHLKADYPEWKGEGIDGGISQIVINGGVDHQATLRAAVVAALDLRLKRQQRERKSE